MYLSFNAPHLPNEAPAAGIERYSEIENANRRVHAAMVSELDREIGRVLAAFEREGMLENTLVLFSSDNGGLIRGSSQSGLQAVVDLATRVFDRPIPIAGIEFMAANTLDEGSDNSPLRDGKASLGEGGARVPAAIWWPRRLESSTHEGFMTISDVLPTLLDAIGAAKAIPPDLNGRSQWAVLSGAVATSEIPDYATTGMFGMVLYRSPWKLVDPESPRLYQIYDDPFEETDRAAEYPEIVEALVAAAAAWPRGTDVGSSLLDLMLDPDQFGGSPEDREPCADVARDRSRAER